MKPDGSKHEFRLLTKDRIFKLFAQTSREKTQWLKAFNAILTLKNIVKYELEKTMLRDIPQSPELNGSKDYIDMDLVVPTAFPSGRHENHSPEPHKSTPFNNLFEKNRKFRIRPTVGEHRKDDTLVDSNIASLKVGFDNFDYNLDQNQE